jgi:phage baseplate assembly protein gpV
MRKLVASLTASAVLFSFAASHAENTSDAVSAETQPDGTVTLSGGSVAAGIGYVWGHGDLNYGGKSHPFKISGLSIVDVGAANITASGHVYNLKKLADFSGNYVEVSAGLTVAGGGSAAYMRNEHGVVIKLESTTVGLRFNLSGDGVKLTLKS